MQSINQHIATVLKRERKRKGWSLDTTAEATGVSKAMLGQIEREESSPTIATLWKIATGMSLSFTSLVTDTSDGPLPILLHEAGQSRAPMPEDSLGVEILFPYDPLMGFEYMELTLPARVEHLSEPHESGVVEHVVVIKGKLEILHGNEWIKLKKGDALRFAADEPHGYRNTSQKPVIFHNVIRYPHKG
ncbi:helix-turn-helix domain-containing protein [Hahella ganghwensis]|uniref:helix-turn-helix domain-containing protein n=1 Tax=Hahella ganghwensis TaxID=286420 RepID=UPI0003778DC9|nr:XRE family transcriptional regulator [Hahella ganghwensis]